MESTSGGEGWYTAQESTDTDFDEVRTEGGGSNFEWHLDELVSGSDIDEGNDDIEGYGSFPTFSMPKKMDEYRWEIGTYFTEKHEFIEAIRTYALANGKSLKFLKKDNQRVSVKCLGANGECKWYAYCGYMGAVKSWQLRKIIYQHTCSRDFNVKLMNAKWLSKKMEKTVRENPNMKVMDIRDKVSRKWNVGVLETWLFGLELLLETTWMGVFQNNSGEYMIIHTSC